MVFIGSCCGHASSLHIIMKLNQLLKLVLSIALFATSLYAQSGYQVPSNDKFKDRIELFGTNVTATGDNILATAETGEPGFGISSLSHTVWYTWTAPIDGVAIIDQIGTGFFSILSVYTGPYLGIGNNLPSNYYSFDFDSAYGGSVITIPVVQGQVIQMNVYGFTNTFDSPVGIYQFNIHYTGLTAPKNDNFAQREFIPSTGGVITTNNTGGTREKQEPNHGGNTGGESLWYSWTANSTGRVIIKSTGTNFDTVLGVYFGDELGKLFDAKSNNAGVLNATTDTLDFKVIAGETYAIAIDGYQGRVGNIKLQVTQGPAISLSGSIYFGTRPVKSNTSRYLTVKNTGFTTLKLRGVELPVGFSGSISGSIEPGRTQSFKITFSPRSKGIFRGELKVKSNTTGNTNTVIVRGIAN